MELWEKVYVVEVEVEWMDDVSVENPVLSAQLHFMVESFPTLRHCLQEAQSRDYTLGLILLNLYIIFYFT